MKSTRLQSASDESGIFAFSRVPARGFAHKIVSAAAAFAALLLPMMPPPCHAQDAAATNGENPTASCPVPGYFADWFDRVSKTQAEQPHWVTPLATVTPRLEEELRSDLFWETVPGDHDVVSYGGGGGKGLEFIPTEHIEFIVGVPAWQTEDALRNKNGWSDESFLMKYRILSANADDGDYILTAFMGLTVPNGGNNTSSKLYTWTPTIAGGKGWGDFDFQSTLGVSLPSDNWIRTGPGTPVLSNTAFQYRLLKYLWPEVEANYTYWPDGKHEGLNQLFITPGLLIGRLPIAGRVGLTFGAGCQIAVTDHALMQHNYIISARLPF
jgi:hypothetical protein